MIQPRRFDWTSARRRLCEAKLDAWYRVYGMVWMVFVGDAWEVRHGILCERVRKGIARLHHRSECECANLGCYVMSVCFS
jgi:hypothetical protein